MTTYYGTIEHHANSRHFNCECGAHHPSWSGGRLVEVQGTCVIQITCECGLTHERSFKIAHPNYWRDARRRRADDRAHPDVVR